MSGKVRDDVCSIQHTLQQGVRVRLPRRFGALTITIGAVALLLGAAVPVAASGPDGGQQVDVIVVLEPSASPRAVAAEHGADVSFVYEHAVNGFAGSVPSARLNGLRHDPRVEYVEFDAEVRLLADPVPQVVPTGIQRTDANDNTNIAIDGLDDRVDVDVAIIDSGVDSSHPDLLVASAVGCTSGNWRRPKCSNESGYDTGYHGTHVAGTVAALDNDIGVVGVAPGARLHSVRVFPDNGPAYASYLVAGIDWVAANAATIEVANMSLGFDPGVIINSVEDAIDGAVGAGVTIVVAAGNDSNDPQVTGTWYDASLSTPGNNQNAIVVSAVADFDGAPGGHSSASCYQDDTEQDDTLADFSNVGANIDMAAPGYCILSTIPFGKWAVGGVQVDYARLSGTSMAAPHVAGAAALLASADPNLSPSQILNTLQAEGTTDWLDESGDSKKEGLLNVGDATVFAPAIDGGSSEPPGNAAPTASFTETCTDLTCDFTDTSTDTDGSVVSRSWKFGDGDTSTAENPSHTYGSDGTYTVELTVVDDDGDSDTTSHTVTVSATEPPPSGDGVALSSTSTNEGRTWTAIVTVHNGDPNTSYAGSWGNGFIGDVDCTTGSTGTCTIEQPGIRKNEGSVTFTLDGGPSITVSKP